MAAIFRKPGNATWWITCCVNGLRVRHSLRTREERIARLKLKKIEGDVVSGELVGASHTPLVPFLTAFCEHVCTIRTRKSYKNDLLYLRTFFGPVCDGLVLGTPVSRCRFAGSRSRPAANGAGFDDQVPRSTCRTRVTSRLLLLAKHLQAASSRIAPSCETTRTTIAGMGDLRDARHIRPRVPQARQHYGRPVAFAALTLIMIFARSLSFSSAAFSSSREVLSAAAASSSPSSSAYVRAQPYAAIS